MSRILIVEDEPLIGLMLADWLEELGHEPSELAVSVDAAMSEIQSRRPDAAILDVTLGRELSYPIAERLSGLGVPFAFATGHGSDSLDGRFRTHPALSKPYDFAQVRSVVAELTGRPAQATSS